MSQEFKFGLARVLLSLYLVITLGLTSCATPGIERGQPGPFKAFVYSPYMDIHVPMQAAPAQKKSFLPDGFRAASGSPTAEFPPELKTITIAFATGECGSEVWDGMSGKRVAEAHINAFQRANVKYMVSTGGADGVFSCGSEQGMEKFIARYTSSHLLGFDFDIEASQSEQVIADLVKQVGAAMVRYPNLRFSFTLATFAGTDANRASLNKHGIAVMKAIERAGLKNYFINLMVMNFGEPSAYSCVVEGGRCNMAASAMQSVQNFNQRYGVPLHRIEVTPMIGINDITSNVFTLSDARALAQYVRSSGLGGLHFWSINRDGPCESGFKAVSPYCNSLPGAKGMEFTSVFAAEMP